MNIFTVYGKCDDYTTMSHFAVANSDPWTMWDITVLYIYKYCTMYKNLDAPPISYFCILFTCHFILYGNRTHRKQCQEYKNPTFTSAVENLILFQNVSKALAT